MILAITYTDIYEVTEMSGDEGMCAVYVKDHVDAAEFFAAVLEYRKQSYGFPKEVELSIDDVHQGWWRLVPRGRGLRQFHEAAPHARGAFKVTYIDVKDWIR